MTYNLTAIATNSSSGFVGFSQGINVVLLDGWLGVLILIGVTIMTLIAFMTSTNNVHISIAGSLFLSFVMALILRAMNLVPNLAIFLTLLLTAAAVATIPKK